MAFEIEELLGTRVGISVYSTRIYELVSWESPRFPAVMALSNFLLALLSLLSLPGASLFYGTAMPLILVLVIKEMPIGTHMMRTAFGQVSSDLEEASLVCGSSRFATFRRIALPIIAPTLASMFSIVFFSALRDISATILSVTAGNRSLSVMMLENFRGGQLKIASIIGVVMAAAIIARRLGLTVGIDS